MGLTGTWQVHPEHGRQMSVTMAAPSRPTGRLFIRTVNAHRTFLGIGVAKAQRFWDRHGEAIYQLLDAGSAVPFIPTLGPELAGVLVAGRQGLEAETSTYRWLTSLDVPPYTPLSALPSDPNEREFWANRGLKQLVYFRKSPLCYHTICEAFD